MPKMVALEDYSSVLCTDVAAHAAANGCSNVHMSQLQQPVTVPQLAHQLLVNCNSRSKAQVDSRVTVQARREHLKSAERVAAMFSAAATDTLEGEYAEDSGDDRDWEQFAVQEGEPSPDADDFLQQLEQIDNLCNPVPGSFEAAVTNTYNLSQLHNLPDTGAPPDNVAPKDCSKRQLRLATAAAKLALSSQLPSVQLHRNQRLLLVNSNSLAVKARLEVMNPDTQVPQVTDIQPGSPPPFIRLEIPPTITDTILLFTLNRLQALAFAAVASRLQQQLAKQPMQDQLLALLLGGPGTGKSQVLQALEWFAYQHDIHQRIAVTAYTWRAALHVSTPSNPACSTSPSTVSRLLATVLHCMTRLMWCSAAETTSATNACIATMKPAS